MNASPPTADGSSSRCTVLVVEDEILIRLDLADILREGGYHVHEAADAGEALALLQAVPTVNLVITDVRMPGELDGLGLARRLRMERPGLPVVIASAHWQDDGEQLADRMVAKPYTAEQILQITGELVEHQWPDKLTRCRAS